MSSFPPHPRFYFSDGSLYVSVENTLYRVHRYLFETHASRFPGIVDGLPSTGTSEYSVHIKDVKQVDFDRLLACLYPRALCVEENRTTEEWTSVLKLASKWVFESLKEGAMAKVLEAVTSPIDQVLFGQKYDVPDLIVIGYASLCQSAAPLSYEEGIRLGMQEVIGIYQLRYELYGSDTRGSDASNEVLDKVRIYMSSRALTGDSTVDGHGSNLDHSDIDGKKSVSPASSSALSLRTSDAEPDAEPDKKSAPASDAPDPQQGVLPTRMDGSELQAPNPVFEYDRDNAPALGIGFAPPSDTLDDIHGATSEVGARGDLNRHHPEEIITETTIPSGGLNDGTVTKLTSSVVSDDLDCQRTPRCALSSGEGIGAKVPFEGEQTSASKPSIEHRIIPNTPSDSSRVTSVAIPDPSEAAIQALLNNLSTKDFDPVSSKIIQQMNSDPTGSQMVNRVTQMVVKKAVEEVGQSETCCRLCGMIHLKGHTTTGKKLFYRYLKENFERIFAAAHTYHQAQLHRLRLVEFIGELSKLKVKKLCLVVHEWVTMLLADACNEEKTISLGLLMTRVGPSWDGKGKLTKLEKKLCNRMNEYFQKIDEVATNASNSSRARSLLKDVIEIRRRGWPESQIQALLNRFTPDGEAV